MQPTEFVGKHTMIIIRRWKGSQTMMIKSLHSLGTELLKKKWSMKESRSNPGIPIISAFKPVLFGEEPTTSTLRKEPEVEQFTYLIRHGAFGRLKDPICEVLQVCAKRPSPQQRYSRAISKLSANHPFRCDKIPNQFSPHYEKYK